MKYPNFFKTLCALFFFYSAAAQSVTITALADRQRILIGEPFQVTLKASAKGGKTISWPHIDSIPHFEILSTSKIDTQTAAGTITLQQTLTLTSWDSGRWQLPSFTTDRRSRTKAVIIDVTYSSFDRNKDYNDVKDILSITKPTQPKWYWYIIGAALLLLLFALLFPGKKKKPAAPPPATDDIYKSTLQKLEGLKNKATTEDAKVFYTELIQIFRDYLYKRKGIQSLSKTTDDLAVQLNNTLLIPDKVYQQLLQTLHLSDMVKFAQVQPQPSDAQSSLQIIKQTVTAIEELK